MGNSKRSRFEPSQRLITRRSEQRALIEAGMSKGEVNNDEHISLQHRKQLQNDQNVLRLEKAGELLGYRIPPHLVRVFRTGPHMIQ